LRYEYDSLGRPDKAILPMNEETAYQYDAASNLTYKTDPMNQTTEYVYDDASRLKDIRFADSRIVTLSYDNAGNLTGYSDGVTSAVYGYDDADRKISETVNYGAFTKTSSYTYYQNGLKQSFSMPDGTAYSYAYGDNNELVSISIPGHGAITYSGYTWFKPERVTFPGGGTREYVYDALQRISRLTARDPGGNPLLEAQFTYDAVNNLLQKDTEHGTYDYTYDGLSRLIRVQAPGEAAVA
jgi:YD repeat-containing protein